MKDLEKLVIEVKDDFDFLSIKYGKISKFTVNTRAKKRYGQCKKIGINTFEINISSLVLQDDIDSQIAKNVIAHELLHTVNGCFAHKGKWKILADKICKTLPNYSIKTRDKFDEISVDDTKKSAKYIIHCNSCSFTATRYKRSKVVMYPQFYQCPKCKGKLYIEQK